VSRPRLSARDPATTDTSLGSFSVPCRDDRPDVLVERIADRVADRLTLGTARPLLLTPSADAPERGRVVVAKEVIVIASLDPYLTLKAAAEYGGVSVRWLRAALTDPVHPLPCYRPGGKGGKVLVRRSDFDTWMAQFRAVGDVDLDAIVNEMVNDLA